MPRYRGVGRWMTDDEMEAVYNLRLPIVAKIRKLNQRGTLPQRLYDYKKSGIDWYKLAAQ